MDTDSDTEKMEMNQAPDQIVQLDKTRNMNLRLNLRFRTHPKIVPNGTCACCVSTEMNMALWKTKMSHSQSLINGTKVL